MMLLLLFIESWVEINLRSQDNKSKYSTQNSTVKPCYTLFEHTPPIQLVQLRYSRLAASTHHHRLQ